MREQLRTDLAQYAHDEAWSGWMKYLFSKCIAVTYQGTNTVRCLEIPWEFVQRWGRQSKTPFLELPENEQASDYAEADKILSIIDAYIPENKDA